MMHDRREPAERSRVSGARSPGVAHAWAGSRLRLHDLLSSRRALRRAVLLQEILGKPRGLEQEAGAVAAPPPDRRQPSLGDGRNGHGAVADETDRLG